MTELTLAEVAADVAKALCSPTRLKPAWHHGEGWATATAPYIVLFCDGTNIGTPDWFWRCCEWLAQNGWDIQLGSDGFHEAWNDEDNVAMNGPIPISEAPARLVSAVWRRTQK